MSLNNSILGYVSLFVRDDAFLQASLVLNPFSYTEIREEYDETVKKILQTLNSMYLLDKTFIKRNSNDFLSKVKILFLSVQKCIFDRYAGKSEKTLILFRKKVQYTLDILETLSISALRDNLEDRCFEYLDTESYFRYEQLRKESSKNFPKEEERFKYDLENRLRKNGIEATVLSRIKTLYSIHKKIQKKNILYSQVLDTIGFRVITKCKEDCYKVMAVILKSWPILNSKIKDYIALPKENGYESIHITVVRGTIPAEIQIRSIAMDSFAEYGSARHDEYKKEMGDD